MESKKTRALCKGLHTYNCIIFAVVAQKMQQPHWPDRYICHSTWRGWVEFKDENTRLTPGQRLVLRGLRERGDNAWVARFVGETIVLEDEDGWPHGRCDLNPGSFLELLRTAS